MTSFLHPLLAEIFGIGGPELIVLRLIILLLFGAKRVPELVKGIGQSVREFKKATREDEEDDAQPPKPADKAKAENSVSE